MNVSNVYSSIDFRSAKGKGLNGKGINEITDFIE